MMGDFWRGWDEIGDHDDAHSGSGGAFDSGQGIFQDEALGGFYVEPAGGEEEDVGSGFAVFDFVAGGESVEARIEVAEIGDGMDALRGGGDGFADRQGVKVVEEFDEAGLTGDAVKRDMRVPMMGDAFPQFFEGEVGAPAFAHKAGAVDSGAADEGEEQLVVDFVAEVATGVLEGDARDGFGVEHEAVHVEDDGGEGDHFRVSCGG